MAGVAAVPIAKFGGVQMTDDGQFALVNTTRPDGTDLVLAIATDQLLTLIDIAAYGRTQARKLQKADPGLRETYDTTRWELSQNNASGLVILSLTFGGGGRLDFGLPNQMPAQLLETLQVMLGVSSPRPSGTRPN